jgi:hypothetical protein
LRYAGCILCDANVLSPALAPLRVMAAVEPLLVSIAKLVTG